MGRTQSNLGLLNVDLLRRPGQAAQNLLSGDFEGAGAALLAPDSLTAEQQDRMLKQMGVDKGPYARVYRMASNGMLIAALALAYKFPIPTAQNMVKLHKSIGGMMGRFPIIGKMASMQTLFRGVKVPGEEGVLKEVLKGASKGDVADVFANLVKDTHYFREKYGMKLASHLEEFKSVTGRYANEREQVMASAWLDGLHKSTRGFQGKDGLITIGKGVDRQVLPAVPALLPNLERAMSPHLKKMVKGIRKSLDESWHEVFGNVKDRKQIMGAIKRQKSAGLFDEESEAVLKWFDNPKAIHNYFPHRAIMTPEALNKAMRGLTDVPLREAYAQKAMKKATSWASPEVMKRQYGMVPSEEHLGAIKDLIDPKAMQALHNVQKARLIQKAGAENFVPRNVLQNMKKWSYGDLRTKYNRVLNTDQSRSWGDLMEDVLPGQYDLRLTEVLKNYNHTLGGTFAWTSKGHGEALAATYIKLEETGQLGLPGAIYARERARMLKDTYIPIAMGRGTYTQNIKALMHEDAMHQLASKLESPWVAKILGPELKNRFQKAFTDTRGSFSLLNLNRKAAGYFYLSTLGVNPGSALKNLLQMVLTTGPTLGYQTTAKALGNSMKKSHKYFSLRLGGRRMLHEDALALAYPEFKAAGLHAAPLADEALANTLSNAAMIGSMPSKAVSTSQRIQRAMMSMFTASETTVRVATFEAGLIHGKRSGLAGKPLIEFARKMTEQTQFMTGPQNTPYRLLEAQPLVRQLTQFPARMLEFATSTAFSMGSGTQNLGTTFGLGKDNFLAKYNPYIFSRMVAGSIIAMEVGEQLGLDIGDALIGGALPGFSEPGRVLAPIPIVPPAIQLLGAAAFGFTGDWEELRRSTPLLIPGGVSIARVAGISSIEIGEQFSHFIERDTADYNNPTPDGRIPVYTPKGTLKGYYTQWQLIKRGIGVRAGDDAAESQLAQKLVSQSAQIKEARQQYLAAHLKHNQSEARNIAMSFQRKFGHPLPVSKQHMETMQSRRLMSRLELIVQQSPPGPARENAVRLISETMSREAEKFLGLDPAYLGSSQSTRQSRRIAPMKRTQAPYLNSMGPLEEVQPQQLGRAPLTGNPLQ